MLKWLSWSFWLKDNPEYLILDYFEELILYGSWKSSIALLIPDCVLIVPFIAISKGKICVRVCALVTPVCNANITPLSEYRAVWTLAINQILLPFGHHLLLEVQRQQKCVLPRIMNPPIRLIPCVLSETCDGLAELSPHNRQSVGDVVALSVESESTEAVLGAAIEQLQSLRVV